MTDEEEKRGGGKIPTWSGKLSELPEYKRRVRLYRLGTAPDRRQLLGPRLLEALASHPAAWQFAPEIDEADLIEDSADATKGAHYLARKLGELAGFDDVTETTTLIHDYFQTFMRKSGESVASYLSREKELNQRLLGGLQSLDDTVTTVVPDVIRGVLTLKKAGLTAQERAAVRGAVGGDIKYKMVCKGLIALLDTILLWFLACFGPSA